MTYYLFINGNIVKGQKDEPITIETYLGGFILSAVFIDKNINKEHSINFNSTHVLHITVEDDFVNDYKEEKFVYQDELKGQLNKFRETESFGLNDYIEDDNWWNVLMMNWNLMGHDSVKLHFRKHGEILPNNFQNWKTLLVQLLNKLNPDLLLAN